ncbi:hypothetical protein JCM10450v2_000083 [Rhodotorula kratochvilovae]
MFALLASPVARAAFSAKAPLSKAVSCASAPVLQTSLEPQPTPPARRTPRSPPSYPSSTLSYGSPVSRPIARRVGRTFPKPARAPFPTALAIKPLTTLAPIISRAEVKIAALVPGFEARDPIRSSATSSTSPSHEPKSSTTPSTPAYPSPAAESAFLDLSLYPTHLGHLPRGWVETLTPSGIYKALVLRDWLDDNKRALGTAAGVAAACNYGVKRIEDEEALEREFEAAAARCPPKWCEREVRRDERLDARMQQTMYLYLAEAMGTRLTFAPAHPSRRRAARTSTPLPPSCLAVDSTASLLSSETDMDPSCTRRRIPRYSRRALRRSRLAGASDNKLRSAAEDGYGVRRWALVNAYNLG